ncbi:SDR family oxidoreductase [Microbacterium sp.]|uniref:SDR family oxidoreductase n=1 Tax=Microbacterium sp. TaxID=51671 RepID=UPI003A875068
MSPAEGAPVALITGAGSGIGRACALRFARDGHTVVLAARSADRIDAVAAEIRGAGGRAETFPVDVADVSRSGELIDGVEREFGRLDVLVNAAGVMTVGPSLEVPIEQWQAMIDTNITGLIMLCRLAMPLLVKTAEHSARGVCDIVNISSLAGRSSKAHHNVYNATKWAVIGFSGALRQEFAGQRVRVSVIEPGLTATEIFSKQPPAARDYFAGITADKDILGADDVAESIEFIVTRPRHVALSEVVIHPAGQA